MYRSRQKFQLRKQSPPALQRKRNPPALQRERSPLIYESQYYVIILITAQEAQATVITRAEPSNVTTRAEPSSVTTRVKPFTIQMVIIYNYSNCSASNGSNAGGTLQRYNASEIHGGNVSEGLPYEQGF